MTCRCCADRRSPGQGSLEASTFQFTDALTTSPLLNARLTANGWSPGPNSSPPKLPHRIVVSPLAVRPNVAQATM